MEQYLNLLRDVVTNGVGKDDRTGTGNRAVFGRQIRFDLSKGFPLLTTKKLSIKNILAELLWFLSGSTNERDLSRQGINIWKEWADPETGELGRVYGAQWRAWRSWQFDGDEPELREVDQISELMAGLRENPTSRRHIVTAWNPGELVDMALPPCHCLFQFYCEEVGAMGRWGMLPPQVRERCRGRTEEALHAEADVRGIPRYRLSCQLYQRSEKSALVA